MLGDAELARAAGRGDRTALAAIYDRYAGGLYELCRAMLRDPHEASDAVQDTFVIAATRLGQLRDPDRLKSWLFAIARREAMHRSSGRARTRPAGDEALDVPVTDDALASIDSEASATLVWDAAGALSERDRAVLVMHVREGLEGADLADALGVAPSAAYVLLSRAKAQLANAVRCYLLLGHGRDACAELARLVPHAHRALDPVTRKRVARHAAKCATCEPPWSAAPEGLGLLAAAPLLAAPAALRSRLLDDPRLISASHAVGSGGAWRHDGFPLPEDPDRRRILLRVAAALVVVVVLAGVLIATRKDDGSQLLAGPGGPDTTLTTAVPDVGEDTTSVSTTDANNTSTTARHTATTARRSGSASTVAGGAGGGAGGSPTTLTFPTTTTAPSALRVTASADQSTLSASGSDCGPPQTATVTATTSNPTQQMVVLLHWTDGNGSQAKGMSRNGNTWTGTLGPIDTAGVSTWWVTARTSPNPSNPAARSSDHSVRVVDC